MNHLGAFHHLFKNMHSFWKRFPHSRAKFSAGVNLFYLSEEVPALAVTFYPLPLFQCFTPKSKAAVLLSPSGILKFQSYPLSAFLW